MDGHDKLMGCQNRTFPLAVYSSIDTASRKLLWLRVWVTNSDPKLIGRWYLEYLYESRKMPSIIRVDRGSETGIMATKQAFLRQNHGDIEPTDTVVYGPSTAIRMLLAFILIPVIQKQLDSFRETIWNTHRIRRQKNTSLPDGVSDHIYNFPQEYGLEECGKES
ncbi:hypothetical protein AWC38_SpisGene6501 [Stylophora pistillata]|uniref:Integrase catalytic domain-containing protein n=1 Tax=Stylophora pistillata TaxID=50429 RepID=A0A2B4SDP4_STYPI|nr:hypothetical protein AWC38_SpisGene6501 [Stylophora pistillata]